MRIRNLVLPLVAVTLLFAACNDKKVKESPKPVTLKGSIANQDYNGEHIYLQKLDLISNEIVNIDSAKIDNGTFTFTDTITTTPAVGLLSYSGSRKPIPFIMEEGDITLDIDSMRNVSIKGTKENEQYQKLLDELNKPESTMQDNQAAIYNYIKANINNPIGDYFLMARGKNLNEEQLKELLTLADPKIKGYGNYDSLNKRLDVLSATAIGKPYTELVGVTPDGQEIALSQYAGKGNYVLLDFWASWCPPCRREMPAIVELYKQYKDKGLEIVGISIDDKNEDWQKGITDLNITWPQMSDLKGWKSALAEAYGVTSIPQTFLIDREGNIIAKGLNAEQLSEKLQELLK